MKKLLVLVAAAAMSLMPVTASAARVFVRGPVIGFGGGFYGPYWGGPYWGPAYYGYGYGYGYPVAGEVKIDTKSKDDDVFINGAFAGSTKDMKTFHLRPGTYTIEVKRAGQSSLNEKVFVAAGKTVHLQPSL